MDQENRGFKETSLNEDKGRIKFKIIKNSRKMRNFLKIIAFVLIATITGGISGAWVSEVRYNKQNSYNNISGLDKEQNARDIPKNAVNLVAEKVGPAVVGVSNKAQGFLGVVTKDSGSGIIFDSNGYIATNYHVIQGAQKLTVKLASGKEFNAKIIGTDPRSDLAVIKIDAHNLPVGKFGDSSKVKVGDMAIAIGNPLGQEFAGTVTSGIVSALNRKIRHGESIYKVLQTDAAINPGNSGGPLCNEYGEVIGINSLKIGSNENAEGLGFAITINEAKQIIKSLMEYGRVTRVFLGIYGGTARPEQNNGVEGAYVQEVVEGSPAALAGIRPTDIIMDIDGEKIRVFDDLSDVIEKHKVGDKINCKIWRNDKIINVVVTLIEIKR